MSLVSSILANFLTFIMAIVLTITPYEGFEEPVINNAKENCKLTVELISDVHIEKLSLSRKAYLTKGLENLQSAEVDIDAVVIAGDLTNYADEESLSEYYNIVKTYSPAPVISAPGNHDIGHAGDKGVTDITRKQARDNFIKYNNEYMGKNNKNVYYTTKVGGYKFIVLGDEVVNGGHWDNISMSKKQLDFLDKELASAKGKPVFVCCHWEIEGRNGQEITYPDSYIDLKEYNIKKIMEKYKNVFYISGHMHAGIKSRAVEEKYGLATVEKVKGVTYVAVPSYGLYNAFGYPLSATGIQMEVYSGQVIFRPRDFITNFWFTNSVYTVKLAK